ncbi:MAG: signal peptide peptidase SppA [Planctomycetaceae bacterium]|nr:signal peptide peptidase SppA [Planctomycetaceae bacterium]
MEANARVTQSPPPQTIVIQQGGGGGLLRLFALFGWVGFVCCALFALVQLMTFADYFDTSGGITEKHHSGSVLASDKVAIISVSGLIANGEGFVKHQIDRVREDDSVKAIVLRVDSPGGTVTASDYMFHHLTKLREEKKVPMVVSMGSMAASGGYYVAMAVGDQEKSIYAEPTTTTGSIGVILPHYDISGLMERFDVKDDSIASHPRKQMLAMTRPVPDEHRALIQEYIDESFGRFKDIVKKGRPKFREDAAALDELATGEIFSATKAKENGLIDEIGFIEEAIDRAIELANLDKDDTRVVRYLAPASFFEIPGLAMSSRDSQLTTLMELSSPRAYYLATSLPPLVASWSMLLQER